MFTTKYSNVQPHCTNARWIGCQADLNSFTPGELEETTGMLPYYVDEDYPAGPEINEPLPERRNWCGSELSTLEIDVYVWCYALIVEHARNKWMNEWIAMKNFANKINMKTDIPTSDALKSVINSETLKLLAMMATSAAVWLAKFFIKRSAPRNNRILADSSCDVSHKHMTTMNTSSVSIYLLFTYSQNSCSLWSCVYVTHHHRRTRLEFCCSVAPIVWWRTLLTRQQPRWPSLLTTSTSPSWSLTSGHLMSVSHVNLTS